MRVFRVRCNVGIDDRELRDVVATEFEPGCTTSDANLVPTRLRQDLVDTALNIFLPVDEIAPRLSCDKRQNFLYISCDARRLTKAW